MPINLAEFQSTLSTQGRTRIIGSGRTKNIEMAGECTVFTYL